MNGCRLLGADLESVDGYERRYISTEGNKVVHQNVGGSFSCKFRGGDSERVRPAAEVVREEEG